MSLAKSLLIGIGFSLVANIANADAKYFARVAYVPEWSKLVGGIYSCADGKNGYGTYCERVSGSGDEIVALNSSIEGYYGEKEKKLRRFVNFTIDRGIILAKIATQD